MECRGIITRIFIVEFSYSVTETWRRDMEKRTLFSIRRGKRSFMEGMEFNIV
jgi:hypothetical protein